MSHHPERTARNVRPVNQPPSYFNVEKFDRTKGSAPLLYSWGRHIPEHGGIASPAFPKCNKNNWAQ